MNFADVERGVTIPKFLNYEITNWGRVFNKRTGRQMVLSPTLQGDLTVGLTRNRIQYRRSVKVLVARSFVRGENEIFNTPIQLDGDKYNLHAENIVWRPRWFAWDYGRQFNDEMPSWFFRGPILDVENNIEYEHVLEAAIANGSLCKDIRAAIPAKTHVFPGGEKYIYI
jgi:hypothetical protein